MQWNKINSNTKNIVFVYIFDEKTYLKDKIIPKTGDHTNSLCCKVVIQFPPVRIINSTRSIGCILNFKSP